jgi:predicted component of type VI protein secretion system
MSYEKAEQMVRTLKRKFTQSETWTDDQVSAMLDHVQREAISQYALPPVSAVVKTPVSANVEAPVSAAVEAPVSANVETPVSAAVEAPASVAVDAPVSHEDVWFSLQFDGGGSIKRILSPGQSFYIGRAAKPMTSSTDNYVFSHDVEEIWRRVSASHCYIKNEIGGLKLHDTSTNGTWVGGRKVKKETVDLQDGDEVCLYNAIGEQTDRRAKFTIRLGDWLVI